MLAEMCCEMHNPWLTSNLLNPGKRPRDMGPIILIDDNHSWSEAVVDFLGAEGFRVETAESGKQGLDLLTSTDPILIILDVELPDMSGLSLLRELRRRENKFVPVLMVSAEDQSSVMANAFEEGATSFLHKPVAPDLLLRAVRELTVAERLG